MDERRTIKLSECYRGFADSERKVIPIISKCLEGMILAAKSVDERRVSAIWLYLNKCIWFRDAAGDGENELGKGQSNWWVPDSKLYSNHYLDHSKLKF